MERQIKFRGKSLMRHEWVYGSLFINEYCSRIIPLEAIIEEEKVLSEFYIVDPKSVEQFTGLKDKHGKEIYGGDVIRNPLAIAPEDKGWLVVFSDFSWIIQLIGGAPNDRLTLRTNYSEKFEVIGNSIENPELINP